MTFSENLPDLHQAYQNICVSGDPFASIGDYAVSVPGLLYEHPTKGQREVKIDPRVLGACETVFADGAELTDALYSHGALEVAPLSEAVDLLHQHLEQPTSEGIVVGFSGFASAGNSYKHEADAVYHFYDYLDVSNISPVLSIDGASRPGVLGLNSIAARLHEVPTLGYVPLQGLDDMSPHDYLVVNGNTYVDREKLVGATADLLVAQGGRAGTERECEAAIRYGGTVLQLNARVYDKDDLPNTFMQSDTLRLAYEAGNLIVCNVGDDVDLKIEQAVARAIANAVSGRPRRLAAISGQLS